jgi:hypothetical protein
MMFKHTLVCNEKFVSSFVVHTDVTIINII